MADDYTVVRQMHVNDVDPGTGQIVPGWQVTVRDAITGVSVPVFVPDSLYSAENVRAIVEASLAQVRAVHSLGSGSAPATG